MAWMCSKHNVIRRQQSANGSVHPMRGKTEAKWCRHQRLLCRQFTNISVECVSATRCDVWPSSDLLSVSQNYNSPRWWFHSYFFFCLCLHRRNANISSCDILWLCGPQTLSSMGCHMTISAMTASELDLHNKLLCAQPMVQHAENTREPARFNCSVTKTRAQGHSEGR